jgi:hypothetical protein
MRRFVIAALSFLMSVPLAAATVRGKVDFQAVGLPGVTVTLSGVSAAPRTIITDTNGEFAFDDVAPGVCFVHAELAGFETMKKPRGILVRTNDVTLFLTIAPITVTICELCSAPPWPEGPEFTMRQADANKLPLGH